MVLILCNSLTGCDLIYEPMIQSQIPSGFKISKLIYFKSQIDCLLAVYSVESVDFEHIEGGDFSIAYNESKYDYNEELIGITLLSGKQCSDESIRGDFMNVHSDKSSVLLVNSKLNAVIVFHPPTKKLYFSGRD